MPRDGLTPKQEKFSQLYVELGDASKAYRGAYDCSRMKPETVWRNAHELFYNPKVAARVKELQDKDAQRHEVTRDMIIARLAAFAFDDAESVGDDLKVRDRVKSLELLGKQLGMWVERVSHEGPAIGELFALLPPEMRERVIAEIEARRGGA